MTTPTYPDIAAFLTAQLDRVEGVALACDDDGRWEDQVDSIASWDGQSWDAVVSGAYGDQAVLAHIAQHDPAFVLADIAAKRAVVATVMGWSHEMCEDSWYSCNLVTGDYANCRDDNDGTCNCTLEDRQVEFLRQLATPFAEEPGYRPEWRVTP